MKLKITKDPEETCHPSGVDVIVIVDLPNKPKSKPNTEE